MSGGSFDYLYAMLENELTYHISKAIRDLECMAAWLEDPEQNQGEAAKEIRAYVEKLKTLYPDDDLLPVIKDAEWWASFDIGKDAFEKTWREFKGKKEGA